MAQGGRSQEGDCIQGHLPGMAQSVEAQPGPEPCYWLAVASAGHVRFGRQAGFMQVCHGKAGPLRRMRPGDGVVYYSPREVMGGRKPLQALTAIGRIQAGAPYQVDGRDLPAAWGVPPDFHPFRRDVAWCLTAREVSILPLLPHLSFTAGRPNWGYALRFGVLKISEADMRVIAAAMGVEKV